jgi:hypothetical protein
MARYDKRFEINQLKERPEADERWSGGHFLEGETTFRGV